MEQVTNRKNQELAKPTMPSINVPYIVSMTGSPDSRHITTAAMTDENASGNFRNTNTTINTNATITPIKSHPF